MKGSGLTWDPDRYLAFACQRLLPARDLLGRIPEIDPQVIWDLGCGTGAMTLEIAGRWPGAEVHGLDSSAEMLAAAREADPDEWVRWVQGDIAGWAPDRPADLIFANASLHWVPDHDDLFPRLAGCLRPGGVLAVQMPRNFDEPSHRVLAEVARRPEWRGTVGHLVRPSPVDLPDAYRRRLAACPRVEVWETRYRQVLKGPDPVARWVEGTAARPYLAALGDRSAAFMADYRQAVEPHYPPGPDGTTPFPFLRLFVIATR